MGNVCPCPKRRQKKEFTYDVHQETFDMQDNAQNIGEHSPKNEHNDPDNNILTEDIRSTEEQTDNSIRAPDPPPQLTTAQPAATDQLANSNHQLQEQPQPLQAEPPKEEKPKFHANILKPKAVRKKYNPDDYRFSGEKQTFRVKGVDSIKEQQFNIENCADCTFFLFDITANLYVDDCSDCFIFVAPVESTIFLRNCSRLTLIAATKQFRTYNCHACTFSLYCKSQPVIESSSQLVFSPFRALPYSQLPAQFRKIKLEPWNNHWSEIHNFTKKEGEKHHQLVEDAQLEVEWDRAFSEAGLVTAEQQQDCVPFINGDLPTEVQREVFLLPNNATPDAAIIQALRNCRLLRAFQGVVAGEGKEQRRALLLDAKDTAIEQLEEMGTVVQESSQLQTLKAKWFVSFSDTREQ